MSLFIGPCAAIDGRFDDINKQAAAICEKDAGVLMLSDAYRLFSANEGSFVLWNAACIWPLTRNNLPNG